MSQLLSVQYYASATELPPSHAQPTLHVVTTMASTASRRLLLFVPRPVEIGRFLANFWGTAQRMAGRAEAQVAMLQPRETVSGQGPISSGTTDRVLRKFCDMVPRIELVPPRVYV